MDASQYNPADTKTLRPLPPSQPSPLTEREFLLIRQAAIRRRAVRRAARTALGSAVTTLIIGAVALPVALVSWSAVPILMAAGVCGVGVVELLFSRRLRQASPSAPGTLALNQLAFFLLITAYCAGQMQTFSVEQVKSAALSPELRSQVGDLGSLEAAIDEPIERWAPLIVYGLYTMVIVLSAAFQGGLALYYITRRKHVRAYRQATPEWIQRLFIETGA